MPSHYLNQYWQIVNWTLGNKHQWNFNPNSYILIQENAFEEVVCKTATILSQPQCVKVMAWCLLFSKPLRELMLPYWQTPRYKLHWNLYPKTTIFYQKSAFENAAFKFTAILFRPQNVKVSLPLDSGCMLFCWGPHVIVLITVFCQRDIFTLVICPPRGHLKMRLCSAGWLDSLTDWISAEPGSGLLFWKTLQNYLTENDYWCNLYAFYVWYIFIYTCLIYEMKIKTVLGSSKNYIYVAK